MASKSRMFGCSNLKRRAQYLPRCESLWSTNPRSKSLITGPPTSECKIGCENHISLKHSSIALLVIASLLSAFQFNSATKDINVSSHNLHGFKTSSDYHRSCISQYGGIWMGQEHWLSNKQLHQFQSIKKNATSAAADTAVNSTSRFRWSYRRCSRERRFYRPTDLPAE